MAAPTKVLQREESSCQPGAVHTWPIADIASCTACPLSGGKQTSTTAKLFFLLHRRTPELRRSCPCTACPKPGYHSPPRLLIYLIAGLLQLNCIVIGN